MKAIIIDVDGTLANLDHRLHHVRGGNRDWDSFFAAMVGDVPIPDVVWLVEGLATHHSVSSQKVALFVCSGRPEDYRQQTESWLSRHCPNLYLAMEALIMRLEGDQRSDVIVKREMLQNVRGQGYEVRVAIDDRQRVVDMWREEGVTCLQCAQWDEREPGHAEVPGNLHVLVGPSGGGKSTFALMSEDWDFMSVVSSDGLRAQLCGTHRDMSKDKQMWALLHATVKARLLAGLDTVVDATNLKNRDRKAIVGLAPEGGQVTYHVIDRPMEEKRRDADWRAEVSVKGKPLIEYHDEVFRNNLTDILAGDGLPNVTVVDHRTHIKCD